MSDNTTPGNALDKVLFTATELREIKSFDQITALLQERLGGVYDAHDEIGDGFELLKDKSRLVGVPLMFLQWNFAEGDYTREDGTKGEFVAARVAAQNVRTGNVDKYIIVDGSTGIYQQLREFTDSHGVNGGVMVARGLRRSEYMAKVANPKTGVVEDQPAETYYLDTSERAV